MKQRAHNKSLPAERKKPRPLKSALYVMNPKRVAKSVRELKSLEMELVRDLLRYLPPASDSGSDFFVISRWNPNAELVSQLREKSERCCEIRSTLGLSAQGSPGELYLRAYMEASDSGNVHRRGPRRLAEWLLGEMGAYNAL